MPKYKGKAYLLWLLSCFGWLGLQHFYLNQPLKGVIWILTGGLLGLGGIIDLFVIGNRTDQLNKQYLKEANVFSLAF